MPPDRFRATINGGVAIANGTKMRVAADITPVLTTGKQVYVRQTTNPTYVLELRITDGHLDHQAYSMGLPTDDTPWVSDLISILSHTGASTA